MSFTFGFYNSIEGDRKYNAEQMASIFNGVINDGVFASIGEHFAVLASDGMQITVGTGRAWFNGTWSENTERIILECSQSDIVMSRIDAVVLEVNHSVDVRANSIKIIRGNYSTSPKAPTLINDEFVSQHLLATISVPAKTEAIDQSLIQNYIGTSTCPFVTAILETTNVDYLLAQWEAMYKKWFVECEDEYYEWREHLRNELDSNQAYNLQNQIDRIKENVYSVGDLKYTLRTDLGSRWLLCNGDRIDELLYPDLSELIEPNLSNMYFDSISTIIPFHMTCYAKYNNGYVIGGYEDVPNTEFNWGGKPFSRARLVWTDDFVSFTNLNFSITGKYADVIWSEIANLIVRDDTLAVLMRTSETNRSSQSGAYHVFQAIVFDGLNESAKYHIYTRISRDGGWYNSGSGLGIHPSHWDSDFYDKIYNYDGYWPANVDDNIELSRCVFAYMTTHVKDINNVYSDRYADFFRSSDCYRMPFSYHPDYGFAMGYGSKFITVDFDGYPVVSEPVGLTNYISSVAIKDNGAVSGGVYSASKRSQPQRVYATSVRSEAINNILEYIGSNGSNYANSMDLSYVSHDGKLIFVRRHVVGEGGLRFYLYRVEDDLSLTQLYSEGGIDEYAGNMPARSLRILCINNKYWIFYPGRRDLLSYDEPTGGVYVYSGEGIRIGHFEDQRNLESDNFFIVYEDAFQKLAKTLPAIDYEGAYCYIKARK